MTKYIISVEIKGSFRDVFSFCTNIAHKINSVKLLFKSQLQNTNVDFSYKKLL